MTKSHNLDMIRIAFVILNDSTVRGLKNNNPLPNPVPYLK
jgi:hypothetical protein